MKSKNYSIFYKYILSQSKKKIYFGKTIGQSYQSIFKDSIKHFSESKSIKEDHKTIVSNIKSYDRILKKMIKEKELNLKSITNDEFAELHEQITNPQKKCSIDDSDKILFGDGGSSSIIVITKDKKVYKFFTLYNFSLDIDQDKNILIKKNEVKNEIKIFESLTKNIIDRNISHHIVKYLGENKCYDAKSLFKECPSSYVDFLKSSSKTKMCSNLFSGYPTYKLEDKFRVVEIEYCDYSCSDFIEEISNMHTIDMEKYLDIFFFQIIYTVVSIQKVFPYFVHNDLFIRNILGKREKDNGNYYKYTFEGKSYKVPQKKFYPKINDFGYTNLDENLKKMKLYQSEYKDIYNIIFDVYDGGNLGSKSLTNLLKDDPIKIKFLKRYFSTYFNVDIIDKYQENSGENMKWDWYNIEDKDFLKSIEMKHPIDLLNGYFHDIFGKIYSEVLHV